MFRRGRPTCFASPPHDRAGGDPHALRQPLHAGLDPDVGPRRRRFLRTLARTRTVLFSANGLVPMASPGLGIAHRAVLAAVAPTPSARFAAAPAAARSRHDSAAA